VNPHIDAAETTISTSRPAWTGAAAARARYRTLVDDAIAPRAGDFDRTGVIPQDVLNLLAEAGLWGLMVPVERGGTGSGMVSFGVAHEEIGRGCSSVRSLLTVHSMVVHALERWGGSRAPDWLAGLISGRAIGAFCLTEPSVGSDINALTTTATTVDGGYSINGRKLWATGGQLADVLLVFARAPAGVSAFIVPATSPGVEREPVHGMLGTRASMLADFTFADCRVDRGCLVGGEGWGMAVATGALDIGRYSVAAGSVGILQACLDASVSHANSRRQGGATLAAHQLVQQMITSMATDLAAARLLCERAGQLKDDADPATIVATCVAKYFATRAAMRAATDTVQIHGASGCTEDSAAGRLFRDAKIMEIIEGSSQILETLIGRETCLGATRKVPQEAL
jgi:glutaryl-CoA dehydrogenase (non-decarboxylating)